MKHDLGSMLHELHHYLILHVYCMCARPCIGIYNDGN